MVRQRHTTAAVAITIALTVGPAAIAAADPAPLARAEATIAAKQTQASTVLRPNPDEQITTVTSTGLGPCSELCSGGPVSQRLASQPAAPPRYSARALLDSGPVIHAYSTAGRPPSIVRVVTHDLGFDWGDAGIGAGAALILVGIGFGGARAATNGRRRRLRDNGAVVTS